MSHATVDHVVEVRSIDGDEVGGQCEHQNDIAEHDWFSHHANHDTDVRKSVNGRAVGGQNVGAIGTAHHGPSTETVTQPAGIVLEPEQKQSDVL